MGSSLKSLLLLSLLILCPATNFIPSLYGMMEETNEGKAQHVLLNEKTAKENPIIDEGHFPRSVHAHKSYKAPPQEVDATKRRKIILSLDGGGIRGLASAKILQHIEDALSKKLNKPSTLLEVVDLFAGTSTGGLIALLLASGHPIAKCVELYKENGYKIFNSSYYNDVITLWGLIGPRYDVDSGLAALLDQIVGNTPLKEAKKPVVVTTYAPEKNQLLLLDSEHAKNSEKGYQNVTMKEAALATSAAPTYFKAAILKRANKDVIIEDKEGKKETFTKVYPDISVIDGGVAANDPGGLAHALSQELFPGHPVFLLSIGTGDTPVSELNKNGGLLSFAPQALNVFSNGASSEVEKGLKMELGKDYCRLQFKCNFDLADTRPETLQALEKAAFDLTQTAQFNHLIDHLVEILNTEDPSK